MARIEDRNKAIALRLKGMSYSQIKEKLAASKSTLHYWLREYPLPEERIRQLRDWNAQRIERFRQTMAEKRELRQLNVLKAVGRKIGAISHRELFIAGLFLYWAEGSKTSRYSISLTNTDPAMLRFFIQWLKALGVDITRLHGRLHLYTDMDVRKQTLFWAKQLNLPISAFRNPYIKRSDSTKRRNYKGRFGQGTCCLRFYSRDLDDLVSMGVKELQMRYSLNTLNIN